MSLPSLLPTLWARLAQATPAAADGRVLIVIQLDGGNDGHNTGVPFADDTYHRARNKLRLDVLRKV